MAIYICDENGVKGYYPNIETKEIVDILIGTGIKSFLVRRLYDENSIEKVTKRAFTSCNAENVILGYCSSFGYPLKMSSSTDNRPLVKMRGNVIRCYPRDKRHFMTEKNIDIYRSSGIVVFTTETYEDIIKQYAVEGGVYTSFEGEMETINGISRKVHRHITKEGFLKLTGAKSKLK